jgi:ribosomal protein L37E
MSIERKKRSCSKCGDLRYIVSKGLCSYCKGEENLKNKKLRESKRIDEGGTKPTKRIRSSTKAPPRKKPSSNKKKKRGLKSNSVSVLKRSLWSTFSKYIRLRDSDDYGYCHCITSGKPLFWKEAQAGHFLSRRYNNTLYHEQNVHAQSAYDNLHLSGNQYIYGKRVDEIYGAGTADKLLTLSRQEKKFTIEELQEMIVHYKKEVIRLLHEKGLPS